MSLIKNTEMLKKFNIERANSKEFLQYREGRWTKEEHNIFLEETLSIGIKNWKKVINIKKTNLA